MGVVDTPIWQADNNNSVPSNTASFFIFALLIFNSIVAMNDVFNLTWAKSSSCDSNTTFSGWDLLRCGGFNGLSDSRVYDHVQQSPLKGMRCVGDV